MMLLSFGRNYLSVICVITALAITAGQSHAVESLDSANLGTLAENMSSSDMDFDYVPDLCETDDPELLMTSGSVWTHILLPDSDADGLLDGEEAPGDCATSITTQTLVMTNPREWDTDGDGFADGMEYFYMQTDPLDALDPNPSSSDYMDMDGDGVPFILDPDDENVDADGDGYADGYELLSGTNPADAEDTPQLGNVNDDDTTNNLDAILIYYWSLGNLETLARPDRADINIDGFINNLDGIILFNHALGNVPVIPLDQSDQ